MNDNGIGCMNSGQLRHRRRPQQQQPKRKQQLRNIRPQQQFGDPSLSYSEEEVEELLGVLEFDELIRDSEAYEHDEFIPEFEDDNNQLHQQDHQEDEGGDHEEVHNWRPSLQQQQQQQQVAAAEPLPESHHDGGGGGGGGLEDIGFGGLGFGGPNFGFGGLNNFGGGGNDLVNSPWSNNGGQDGIHHGPVGVQVGGGGGGHSGAVDDHSGPVHAPAVVAEEGLVKDVGGCSAPDGRFHLPGESWQLQGICGKATCSKSLAGDWEVWEERCEGGIKNPQYSCLIKSMDHLPFPNCCPKAVQCRDNV